MNTRNLWWKLLYLKGRNFCNKKFSQKKFWQSEGPKIRGKISRKNYSRIESERHILWKKFSGIKATRKSSEKKWTYQNSEDFL